MPQRYRSYVVRVRRRDDTPDGVRADVEDLLGGRRIALSGAAAQALAEGLEAAIGDTADAGPPDADEVRQPPGA